MWQLHVGWTCCSVLAVHGCIHLLWVCTFIFSLFYTCTHTHRPLAARKGALLGTRLPQPKERNQNPRLVQSWQRNPLKVALNRANSLLDTVWYCPRNTSYIHQYCSVALCLVVHACILLRMSCVCSSVSLCASVYMLNNCVCQSFRCACAELIITIHDVHNTYLYIIDNNHTKLQV